MTPARAACHQAAGRFLRRPARKFFFTAVGVGALGIFAGCAASPGAADPASGSGAGSLKAAAATVTSDPLAPSPRLILGRILSVDAAQGFAFVELANDAPAAALVEGTELIVRTLELKETARVRVSRYIRGRTLGTRIVAGQPAPTDEVVWLAP